MARLTLPIIITLAFICSACATIAPGTASPGEETPIISTLSVSTASVATAEPNLITVLPRDFTPPPSAVLPTLTPIPTLPGGVGPTELKYRVLDQFPDIFFCDPDFYPVARADEGELADQHFSELQADTEEFNTILAHNGLAGTSNFSEDQKLLIYREHKKLAAIPFELNGSSYQFQIQVAKTEGNGELVTGSIDSQGSITVQQKESSIAACPICLALGTLIDTPTGSLPVESLKVGMLVWTMDQAGARVALPITRTSKTVVPAFHRISHIVLDDGRELWVSPGHPTVEGRALGQLKVGGSLDGGIIRSLDNISYRSSATYDLLPAGDTGFYWANGILLASTLRVTHLSPGCNPARPR